MMSELLTESFAEPVEGKETMTDASDCHQHQDTFLETLMDGSCLPGTNEQGGYWMSW